MNAARKYPSYLMSGGDVVSLSGQWLRDPSARRSWHLTQALAAEGDAAAYHHRLAFELSLAMAEQAKWARAAQVGSSNETILWTQRVGETL